MATTQTTVEATGNGPHGPINIKTLKSTDIKVSVAGVEKTLTTDYTISDYTTSSFKITFVDGKRGIGDIRAYRDTNVDSSSITYAAGTAIKAGDLNTSFNQAIYKADEEIMAGDIADDAITSAKILDGTIANANISTSAEIAVSKLADGSARQLLQTDSGGTGVEWTSNVDVPGTLDVTGNATFDGSVTATLFSGNVSGSSGSTSGNAATATTATKASNITVVDESTDTSCNVVFVTTATGDLPPKTGTNLTFNSNTGQLTATKFSGAVTGAVTGNADTATDLAADAKITKTKENAGITADDDTYFTTLAADDRYYKRGSADDIEAAGVPWSGNDTTVATTAAIDKRIIDLVDDVGGFVPIATEATFPATNPDINNPATGGTIVSIGVIAKSGGYTPSGGTCTIPDATLTNISGSDVTITDCGTTVLAEGFGCLVETTSTLHQYKFHRLTPKATEVSVVAGSSYKTAIETVAASDYKEDVEAVADSTYKGKVEIVAGDTYKGKVEIVAGTTYKGKVETVADNVTDVSNFAKVYQIATSAPTARADSSSLVLGDLWFDSDDKAMMVRDGSAGDGYAAVSPSSAVLDDIAIVSGNLTRQEDLGSIADELASPTTTSSLETCADNITNINTFANTYFIGSEPSGSNVGAGDLWYDSSGNVLKYNNGSTWTVTAAAGLSEISEDITPVLGGHLDLNSKNLQGDAVTIESKTGTEDYITCVKDGAVTLFHDAAAKLATSATGVTVTGLMSATTIDGAAGANLQLDFGSIA